MMHSSLRSIYAMTDVSGSIHAGNTALSAQLHAWTTQVSSIGQRNQRPASMTRRWATRAVTAAAVSALPVVPLTALTVAPLAVMAFGVGRDNRRPQSPYFVKKSIDLVYAHGVLGLPEHGMVHLAQRASNKGDARQANIFMGIAIALGAAAQLVRVPMALTATCVLLTDGATQILTALGAAAFGILSERYHHRGPQTA